MEPVAGFGHFSPRLQFKYTRFPSVIKDNSIYRPIPFFTLLVSVLVSVGVRAKRAKENQRQDSQYEERLGDTDTHISLWHWRWRVCPQREQDACRRFRHPPILGAKRYLQACQSS